MPLGKNTIWHHGVYRNPKSTVLSDHETLAEAFAELDRYAERLSVHRLPGDFLELLVLMPDESVAVRPAVH